MCTRGLHSDLRQLKKMGDKDSSVTMEPLLSPTKSGKAKVKAARFQVNCKNLEMPIHDLQFRLPVWVLEREGKACEEILLIELRERSRARRLGGKRSRLGGERAPESRFEDKSRLER